MRISWDKILPGPGSREAQLYYRKAQTQDGDPVMLLVKTDRKLKIDNDPGKIFGLHNVIEFKEPEEEVNMEEFYLAQSKALYCSSRKRRIPGEEVTASIFVDAYPLEMFVTMMEMGWRVRRMYPGVYYPGRLTLCPTQVVVMDELIPQEHFELRTLFGREGFSPLGRPT